MTGLAGHRIVVCRASAQAGPLLEAIEAAGGVPVHVPLIEVVPPADDGAALRQALADADESTWVVATSANGIDAIASALPSRTSGSDPTFQGIIASGSAPTTWSLAVVGRATAARAAACSLHVDFESSEQNAAGLASSLPVEPGDRVVAAVAELAGPDLVDGLRARGVGVVVVTAYRTVTPPLDDADIERITGADLIMATAPSVVDRLVASVDPARLPPLVAIGPSTEKAVEATGLALADTADSPSIDGLIRSAVRSLRT